MAVLFSFATLTFIRIGNLKNLNSSNKGNLFTAIDSSCFVFHLNHNLNINIAHKASTDVWGLTYILSLLMKFVNQSTEK
jgi:hypothetical protein